MGLGLGQRWVTPRGHGPGTGGICLLVDRLSLLPQSRISLTLSILWPWLGRTECLCAAGELTLGLSPHQCPDPFAATKSVLAREPLQGGVISQLLCISLLWVFTRNGSVLAIPFTSLGGFLWLKRHL